MFPSSTTTLLTAVASPTVVAVVAMVTTAPAMAMSTVEKNGEEGEKGKEKDFPFSKRV